ncbi:MAG: SDR family oxidoreductase [SAR324 cluster bacterium]|nr:SDR family oxidoreductase [SAR324 cluster bacterium]MBF0351781.1 SDR family oxidoreductase [SAR324 cluster bacterium]
MKSIQELMNLTGRVAVITGGAGHLGQTFAEALTELGAHVVLVDIQRDACEQAAQSLASKHSVPVLPIVLDLEKEEEILSLKDQIQKHFGRLDILINNSAFVGTSQLKGWGVPFDQQSSETWRRALEVNLTAPFVLVQSCLDLLRASGHGSVINIGSTYGVVGPNMSLYEGTSMGNPAAYAASKGGLIQLTRWMATNVAPNIRVNAISPGGIWRNQPEAFHQRYCKLTPMGRMASEQDFKGIIAFLASDLSEYVTGQNFMVDGGWTAW